MSAAVWPDLVAYKFGVSTGNLSGGIAGYFGADDLT